MKSKLREAFDLIDKQSANHYERGKAFEDLVKVYLEHDALQTQQFSKVWHYEESAKHNRSHSPTDIGIDLVAEIRDGTGFCAIQCKYYQPDHEITKTDIDSFISASTSEVFVYRMLIDTSYKDNHLAVRIASA